LGYDYCKPQHRFESFLEVRLDEGVLVDAGIRNFQIIFRTHFTTHLVSFHWLFIAFITWNSKLVPMLEGLCSLIPVNCIWIWVLGVLGFCRNQTDDRRIDSHALWPTELLLHRLRCYKYAVNLNLYQRSSESFWWSLLYWEASVTLFCIGTPPTVLEIFKIVYQNSNVCTISVDSKRTRLREALLST